MTNSTDIIAELKSYGELQSNSNFKIVTLHPLADEIELLRGLDIDPASCQTCDLYWVFENAMYFISISCIGNNPVVSYSQEQIDLGDMNRKFYVTTRHCPLTTSTVELILAYLSRWIIDHSE